MPRLLLFAPCERVIVEQGANNLSLISLIQELTAPIGEDLPANAISPQRWYVLTVWIKNEDESTQVFEQRLEIYNPQDKKLLEMHTDFEMSKLNHRNIATIEGFPIAIAGTYRLRLSLRRAGVGDWAEVATYPILLKHATTRTSTPA